MIVRNKGGEVVIRNSFALFDFLRGELGMRNEKGGVRNAGGDIEILASVPFRVKDGEAEGGGIAWTLSTFDLDRFSERIDPEGWDYSQYLKNPVVEWAHRYDIPAIGNAEGLHADENGLHGLVVFNGKDVVVLNSKLLAHGQQFYI
jgi:hypothetical protein